MYLSEALKELGIVHPFHANLALLTLASYLPVNTSMNISQKLIRLHTGAPPRVLDLFSGCGGFTLGFHRYGFKSIGGIEIDPHAARSYANNFHRHESATMFEIHAASKDIEKLSPERFMEILGYTSVGNEVDVLIGGPPCPAFTRVGRAKLREVHEHPEAFKQDPRWQLYLPYLEYVKLTQPLVLVMENVPDILNFGGTNLAEDICDRLELLGYCSYYTLLNSANYGIPQMRERFILIGYHRQLGILPNFPMPTHKVDFPSGYKGSRDVALRIVGEGQISKRLTRFVPTPESLGHLPDPRTVAEAISDLPPITAHLEGRMKRGARRFDTSVTYHPKVTPSAYAQLMRSWPGFSGNGQIWDHVTRSLSPRDYRLFASMNPGDDYPKAYELAETLFSIRLLELGKNAPLPGTQAYKTLKKDFIPPYDPHKFPNKWRKMSPAQPARTLMAHLGKDSYTHIHYDSHQARVLSVREAARLQGFPDGFRFSGTMNPAFRQIGNAVPSLMAAAIASVIFQDLCKASQEFAESTFVLAK